MKLAEKIQNLPRKVESFQVYQYQDPVRMVSFLDSDHLKENCIVSAK